MKETPKNGKCAFVAASLIAIFSGCGQGMHQSSEPELPAEYGCSHVFSPDRVYAVEPGPEDPAVWTARDVDDPTWTCTFAASRGAGELQVRPSDGALVGVAHEGRDDPALPLPPATKIWKLAVPEMLVFEPRSDPPVSDDDWFLETWPEDGDELLGMPCGPGGYVDRTLVGADGESVLAYCVDPNDSWDVRDAAGSVVYDLGDDDVDPLVVLADGRLLVLSPATVSGLAYVAPGGDPVAVEGEARLYDVTAVRRVASDVLIVAPGESYGGEIPELLLWRLSGGVLTQAGSYDAATFEARDDDERAPALDADGGLVTYFGTDPERPDSHHTAVVRLVPDGTWSTIGSGSDVVRLLTGARLRP